MVRVTAFHFLETARCSKATPERICRPALPPCVCCTTCFPHRSSNTRTCSRFGTASRNKARRQMWQPVFCISWDSWQLWMRCEPRTAQSTVRPQQPAFPDGMICLPRKCSPRQWQACILLTKKCHICLRSLPDTDQRLQTCPGPQHAPTCPPHSAASRCSGPAPKVRSPTAPPWPLCSIAELSPPAWVPELAENRAGLHRALPSQLFETQENMSA